MTTIEERDLWRTRASDVLNDAQEKLELSSRRLMQILGMDHGNFYKIKRGQANLTSRQLTALMLKAREKGIGDWLIDRLAGCESSSDTSDQLESLQLRQALLRRRSRTTATKH